MRNLRNDPYGDKWRLALTFVSCFGASMLGGNCQTPNVPPPDASDAAPAPTPTPTPPLADSAPPVTGDCMSACATLARFHCTTGGDPTACVKWAERDLGSGLVPNPVTHKPLTCSVVAGLGSKADAVAVGFVCP